MNLTLSLRLTIAFALVLIAFGSVGAQQGEISIEVTSCGRGVNNWQIISGGSPRFMVTFLNNTGERVDISNGFRVVSPDGAMWDSATVDSVGYYFGAPSTLAGYFDILFSFRQFYQFSPKGQADTVGIMGAGTPATPGRMLPNGFHDSVLAITVYNIPLGDSVGHICIDTSFFRPGGTWVWVGQSLTEYHPRFLAAPGVPYVPGLGYCFQLMKSGCANNASPKAITTDKSIDCYSCVKCCRGYTGDVNMVGIVDLADLSALVTYLTGGNYTLPCPGEANVDATGIVDLADLTSLVSYLSGGGFVLPACR